MSSPAIKRTAPTFRTALRQRDFRLLLAGHGLGTVAQLVLTLALGVEVLTQTSSSIWVSVTVALGFAPYVVCSGYAGLLADRRSRSAMLTWSFVTRAGCAALLTAGLLLHWPVPLLVLVAAVAAVLATPSYPALAAATPQCVPDAQLPAANALVTGVENVTWMAGPGVLGLVLLSGYGPVVATSVATVLFVGAGLLALRVRLPAPGSTEPTVGPTAGPTAGLWDGLRLVVTKAAVRRPMTLAVIDNFLYGFLVVAMVLLAERTLGGEEAVGWLNAGLSVGALAAMAVVNRLAASRAPAGLLFTVMTVFAAATALTALSEWVQISVLLVAIAGAATLIVEVVSVTMLQRSVPDEQAASVFGVYDQLNVGAIALGSLLAGPLADHWGSGGSIVAVASVCLLGAVLATRQMRHLPRHAAGHRIAAMSSTATKSSGAPMSQ